MQSLLPPKRLALCMIAVASNQLQFVWFLAFLFFQIANNIYMISMIHIKICVNVNPIRIIPRVTSFMELIHQVGVLGIFFFSLAKFLKTFWSLEANDKLN